MQNEKIMIVHQYLDKTKLNQLFEFADNFYWSKMFQQAVTDTVETNGKLN
jgi:hypothetical protein